MDYSRLDYLWLDYKDIWTIAIWTTYDVWTTAVWTTPNWTTYDVWTTAVWTTRQIDYT